MNLIKSLSLALGIKKDPTNRLTPVARFYSSGLPGLCSILDFSVTNVTDNK